MGRFGEWTEDRWPRHTLRYNPQRFICQMLAVIAVELAVVIALLVVT